MYLFHQHSVFPIFLMRALNQKFTDCYSDLDKLENDCDYIPISFIDYYLVTFNLQIMILKTILNLFICHTLFLNLFHHYLYSNYYLD